MDTKDYLNQIIRDEKIIMNKTEEIQRLRTLTGVTGTISANDHIQNSGAKDRLGGLVVKIVDLEREIIAMLGERNYIIGQIEAMENIDVYDVLAKRYILGKTNKEIAFDRKESQQTVCNLINEAIDEFEGKYGSTYLQA